VKVSVSDIQADKLCKLKLLHPRIYRVIGDPFMFRGKLEVKL